MELERKAAVALLALLAGCASPPTDWSREGATSAQLEQDAAQCRNQARELAVRTPNGFVGAMMDAAYRDCMIGRGWRAR